ncbi:MAG: trypsin-like peptidase domain-containing protein [Pseudomonadota bacterium]
MRVILSICCVLALISGPVQAQSVPQSQAEISLSFAPLVKQAAPAVVNIFANRVVQQRATPFMGNPFFEQFFGDMQQMQPRVQNSLGSGVILSEDGIVVSNYHVVGMATDIRVVLKDRREFDASVLLADQQSDIAILKIESDAPLPWLAFRNSDDVEVGELALAIGNPFGIGQTVSSGIISGLSRSGVATGNARGYFIQTDAAINPGNSGGALIDVAGRLIGVNTSILTRSGGSNGVGFAIPSNLVAQFVKQAQDGQTSFMRPWAGISGQAVDSSLAEGFGLSIPEGVVISELHPLSPFGKVGLQEGDIVLSVDDLPVNAPAEMLYHMSVRGVGEVATITYLSNGEVKSTDVALILPPDDPPSNPLTVTEGALTGLSLVTINPAVSAEFGLPTAAQGVIVTRVDGPLRRIGLRRGDIIGAINRQPVETSADVDAISRAGSRSWRIDGVSNGRRFTYRFRL